MRLEKPAGIAVITLLLATSFAAPVLGDEPADLASSWAFPPTLADASASVRGMRAVRPLQDIASSRVYLPGVVNVSGAYGAFFRTRVTVLHVSTSAATATATFYSSGVPRTKNFRLEAAETKTFWNVLEELFGQTGAGALTIDVPLTSDVIASSEVYVDGPNGRFSTATSVYISLDSLGSTYLDWTTGVLQDSGNRANIACVNFSSSASIVKAGLYDAPSPGPLLREYQFELDGYQWNQLSVDVQVRGGTILWKPFGGTNYCYAVNVNNTSNDGTFLDRTTYVP